MKKNKFIGLATLFLALGGLAGCCNKACEHDFSGYDSDDTNHWAVCTKCGEKQEGSEKKHSYKKNPDKVADNKEATCTEAGWEWKKCTCGKEQKADVAALNHAFSIKGDRSNVVSTTATCLEAGKAVVKCSRCDATGEVDDAALGHDWVHDPAKTDIPASCTGKAVLYQKCSRCSATQIIDGDAALGHSYKDTVGTPAEGYATISTSACDNCNSARVFWNANEVTDHCKNDKRKVGEGEDAFEEPNYVEEGDGIRFWGRPIRNAIELNEEGRTDQNADHTPIYAPEIEGSFFEYKIKTTTRLVGAQLIAEYEPTQDLISAGGVDLYKGDSSDWTPGLTTDGQGGSKNLAYRYEISIDGDTLSFVDGANPCTSTDKAWFTFPTDAVTLEPGDHTVRISMAGGYLNTFYNFGFEVVDDPLVHKHVFVKDNTLSEEPDCENDGRFYGVCACEMVKDEPVPKLGHLLEDDPKDTDFAATCDTAGQKHMKCTREGCDHEEDVEVPAAGHDMVDTKLTSAEGFADFNKTTCSKGDSDEYYWFDANQVTDATKNDTRKVTETTVNSETGEEEQTEFAEPNYVTSGNGVKFWGRSKNNAVALNHNGAADSSNHAPVYDATVVGSFVEYKFKVEEKLENVNFAAYMQPSGDLSTGADLWKYIDGDWTPGQVAEGQNMAFRYEVIIDNNVVTLDESIDSPAPEKVGVQYYGSYAFGGSFPTDWYNLPMAAMDVEPGEHTIRIVCGGGYIGTFFKFGFVKEGEGKPVGPVDENPAIKLDVANATGYNDKTQKCKSAGEWTIDHTAIQEGEYSVKLVAKCTSGDHGDRKFYNMAKAELCVNGEVEETRSSSQDTASQADYRYFLKVDGKVVNPDTKKSWGDLGLNTTEFKAVEFVSKIVITEKTQKIAIDHGDIGFSLYIEGIELTRIGDHNHDWVDGATVSGEAGVSSTYKLQSCACGAQRAVISAAQDVNGKITSEGGKLGAKNDTAKYVINVDRAITGTLKAKVSVDNAGNYGYSYYTGKNGGSSAVTLPDGKTNTEMKFNGEAVTMPTATYSEMGITGTNAAGAGIANFGEFTLQEGANEFTLTRLDSFGLSYYEFYFEF